MRSRKLLDALVVVAVASSTSALSPDLDATLSDLRSQLPALSAAAEREGLLPPAAGKLTAKGDKGCCCEAGFAPDPKSGMCVMQGEGVGQPVEGSESWSDCWQNGAVQCNSQTGEVVYEKSAATSCCCKPEMASDLTLGRCIAFDCAGMMKQYDIQPLVAWGSTPDDKKPDWDKNKCNEKVGIGLPEPLQPLVASKKQVCSKHYAVDCDSNGYPLNAKSDAKVSASIPISDDTKPQQEAAAPAAPKITDMKAPAKHVAVDASGDVVDTDKPEVPKNDPTEAPDKKVPDSKQQIPPTLAEQTSVPDPVSIPNPFITKAKQKAPGNETVADASDDGADNTEALGNEAPGNDKTEGPEDNKADALDKEQVEAPVKDKTKAVKAKPAPPPLPPPPSSATSTTDASVLETNPSEEASVKEETE